MCVTVRAQVAPLVRSDGACASVFITFLRRSHVIEGMSPVAGTPAAGKRLSQVAANPVPSPNLPVGRLLLKLPPGGSPSHSCKALARRVFRLHAARIRAHTE